VICTSGSDSDECDALEFLKVNFNAEDGDVTVTDLVFDIDRTGGSNVASGTVAYIYDGSTLVGSASVAGTGAGSMTATFSDIDWVVPADTTRVLAFKMDIVDSALTLDTFDVSLGVDTAVATAITSEKPNGDSITETGSAQGRNITIRKVGPEITLISKSITTSGVPQGNPAANITSTSTLSATFNLKIKAVEVI
jgi:hypothetical protein